MKTTLLPTLFVVFSFGLFAQAPTIEGDTILCPDSNGTAEITTAQTYDSYQWQVRDGFTSDPFVDIAAATSATFTYDVFNYAVKEIRVKVTLGATTYFSNELLIDGYAFLPIFTISEYDDDVVSINPNNGNIILCDGASFTLTAGMPYNTNVQWFKNGSAIDGANDETFTVTGAGEYYVTAAPQVCPDFLQTSLPTVVEINTECNLAVGSPDRLSFVSWPNPTGGSLSFTSAQTIENLDIFSMTGQKLLALQPNANHGNVDFSSLAAGVYLVEVTAESATKRLRIVKQ